MGSVKSRLSPDHHPNNECEMLVGGAVPYPGVLPIVKMGKIAKELIDNTRPDQRTVSGGQVKPGQVDIEIPEHETAAQAYMEQWQIENESPVGPNALRPATLRYPSISNSLSGGRSIGLVEAWPKKKEHDEYDMGGDGKMRVVAWTICYQNVTPA